MPQFSLGGMPTFNMQHGFTEAIVRGFRSGFLLDDTYHHLTQCETLEDFKLNLQETDYGQMLSNEAVVNPPIIEKGAINKLVVEFFYIRAQAVEPLATFMDYITYEYMIENIMLLLRGTLSGRSTKELMLQCHPLGMFNPNAMKNIPLYEATPKGYADLYETVLVDVPVGKYFQKYLDASSKTKITAPSEVRNVLEEVQIEILRNSLLKLYLEDFYTFCEELGGETAEVMCGLLRQRADRNAINITLNSFNTPLNDPAMRDTYRKGLYPSIGTLYPEGTEQLIKVDDDAKLVQVMSHYALYRDIFEKLSSNSEEFSIDDEFYKHEVKLFELAFESQMHFGVFYAYVKLKEQEIRNLVWISECILQRRKDQIGKFVPIFSVNDSKKNH
eukprot:gene9451-12735_t